MAKTILFGVVVIALLLFPAARANAAGCDALVGDWNWFATETAVTLRADHVILNNGAASGTWVCSDSAKGVATLHWKAGFVDTVYLSSRDWLTGHNQTGAQISASRRGRATPKGTPTGENEPPSSATPNATATASGAPAASANNFSVAGVLVYVRQKNWNGLIAYTKSWTQTEPKNAQGWYYMGNAYGVGLNQPADAASAFERAVSLDSQWYQAWNALGETDAQLKRWDASIGAFKHAVELKPAQANYRNNLAAVYSFTGKFDLASQSLDDEQKFAGPTASASDWYNLGNGFHDVMQYAKAVSAYQQAVRLNPRSAEAWNNLGTSQQELGNAAEALQDYKQASTLGDSMGTHNYTTLQNAIAVAQQAAQNAGKPRNSMDRLTALQNAQWTYDHTWHDPNNALPRP